MDSPADAAGTVACLLDSLARLTAPGARAHSSSAPATLATLTAVSRSPQGKHFAVVLQQQVRRHESFNARPGSARGRAQQRQWRVAHLIAAVGSESLLCGETGLQCAGVVLPLWAGVEFLRVGAQAR